MDEDTCEVQSGISIQIHTMQENALPLVMLELSHQRPAKNNTSEFLDFVFAGWWVVLGTKLGEQFQNRANCHGKMTLKKIQSKLKMVKV